MRSRVWAVLATGTAVGCAVMAGSSAARATAAPSAPALPATAAAVTAVAVADPASPTARSAPPSTPSAGGMPHDPRHTVVASIVSGRLLFVGASYSIGLGATGPADTMPELIAKSLGRELRVDAVSGTGYQNPGPRHQGTFAERIAKDSGDPAPRIVVLQGGRDDVGYPVAREYAAACSTIDLARTRFPSAQVVLLGPVPAQLPVNPRVREIEAELARAAAASGAGFIDPIADSWITPDNERGYRGRVPGHPNDAGYAYLARRLIGALPVALERAAPPADRPSSGTAPTRAATGRTASSGSTSHAEPGGRAARTGSRGPHPQPTPFWLTSA